MSKIACIAAKPSAAKRKGRGKSAKSIELIEAARKILAIEHPTSVRAVCYRLFAQGLIPNMKKTSTDAVGKQLVWARENGIIPWEWITDETRETERPGTWDNPDQIINRAVKTYRRDHWQDQPLRVEVISEKGTIRGAIAPVLEQYGVALRVFHGFSSATSVYDLSADSRESDKPLILLYVGDWDPSGLCMSEQDLPGRIERYEGKVTIKRIALTADDVAPGTPLPHFEAKTKAGDSRYKWFISNYGTRCWELDAMPSSVLRERLATEIEAHIDADLWNRAIEVETAETDSMRDFMVTWRSISGQAAKYSEGGR